MSRGTIKKVIAEKGYGYIDVVDDKKDVKFYLREIKNGYAPKMRDSVIFETGRWEKGQAIATDLKAAKASFPSGQISQTHQSKGAFPYTFVGRVPSHRVAFVPHDRLQEDRIDIAFDVEWTTETPTALVPCENPAVPVSAINSDNDNSGYNKRWLFIDNRPAISPFTVKGAIANGFANLLGGCYRVVDRTEGHKANATAEGFPYTGGWKRYRVAMNKSYAGIVKKINLETGFVEVEKVTEYYFDKEQLPIKIQPGEACDGKTYTNKHKNFIDNISSNSKGSIIYHGPYSFGMDLSLKPGDMGKKHYHRFYKPTGTCVEGFIPKLNFAAKEETKKQSYAGIFCKGELQILKTNPRRDLLGEPWYQDLRKLNPNDWCYYTTFQDSSQKEYVTGIGKNFQFKTFFHLNDDCVLTDQRLCDNFEKLCPRCLLFGSTVDRDQNSNGYAGRFKAATLIADFSVEESSFPTTIPSADSEIKVDFATWKDSNGEEKIKQVLLPIMGPPKPSKRDADGYFNKRSGLIKGAKSYRHSDLNFDTKLPNLLPVGDKGYAYRLCGVAPVCKEGITFKGTLGGESCSPKEVAALLLLLDKRLGGNVFKLGLGKHLGLGSVSSCIKKIWLRCTSSYTWQQIDIPADADGTTILDSLNETLPLAVKQVNQFPKELLNTWDNTPTTLRYPRPGNNYWREAKVETRK